MRLHYLPGTAAMAPHAALAEIGVPYELVPVERDEEGRSTEAYLTINPWGKVPTLEDGDLVLTESAAICLYLADKFRKRASRRRSAHGTARSSTAGCSGCRTPCRPPSSTTSTRTATAPRASRSWPTPSCTSTTT